MGEQFKFKSPLAPFINGFISGKDSAGCAFLRGRWICLEIDKFFLEEGLTEAIITAEIVEKWRSTRTADSKRTLYAKYNIWQQLARYMNRNGCHCYVPQSVPMPHAHTSSPYIFTTQQMLRIFEESNKMTVFNKNMRNGVIVMPALIRFLYSTGVRISEALSITNRDLHLDEGFILLRTTKNGHERLTAINESLKSVLLNYIACRDFNANKASCFDKPLFVKLDGSRIAYNTVTSWFKKILKASGIPCTANHIGEHQGPRVHDLRHTAACHALAKMIRTGKDPNTVMPVIREWLGHRSIRACEGYLRLTSELYPDLREIMSSIEKRIKTDYVYEE